MENTYFIYANISGRAKWHLVYDRNPGLYFVDEDFEEDEYDIEAYREDFPDNEIIPVPSPAEARNPIGLCDKHRELVDRVDCFACDFLFVYDRLDLAISQMNLMLKEDERKIKKRLRNFLEYCQIGVKAICTCGKTGERRCPKHSIKAAWRYLNQ